MSEDLPLTITAAGLLLTDWCPARCRHCYVQAGPECSRWMAPDAAAAHLAALARMGVPAAGVHIGGGEPFGDFERLQATVLAARPSGLGGVGYVETNGYWAESEEVVRQRLAALDEAGMMQLSISADPYHQEFIPPERVRLLHAVAREVLGPQRIRGRRWKWMEAPQDTAAMTEGDRRRLFAEFLKKYFERMSGRAAAELADLVPRVPADELPADGCRAAILGSGHIHIDPDGWVYPGTCAGIIIGRATADLALDELLRRWRPDPAGIIAMLIDGGPRRLLAAAEARGMRSDARGYAGKCHMCWAARAHLVSKGGGGDELQPASLYDKNAGRNL